MLGLAVGPFGCGVNDVGAYWVNVLEPQRCAAVQDVEEDGHGDKNMCCGSALEIQLLALLITRRVHSGREVDHPCEDRLDEGVVQQVHGETDSAEEVEDRGCEDLPGSCGEEDSDEHDGRAQVVPIAADIGFVTGHAVHDLVHYVRPVRVLRAVLRVASKEHAQYDHHGGDGRREDGGCGIFVVVMEFGDEHARDDVQALESANCESCWC